MVFAPFRARNILCLSTLAAIGVLSAPLQAYAADNAVTLSAKPEQAGAELQFQAQTSTIAPTVEVPYSIVEQAANAAADAFAGPRSGHTRIGCQNVGFGGSLPVRVTLFKGCADYDWNVTAARNGNINVKRAGDGISLDVPVKFTGNGNFTGELSKAIKTPNQNFSGTFVVSVTGQIALDKKFCPKVENATAHFAWGTAPNINIIGKSCLEVGHGLNACIGPWKFPAQSVMADQINKSLASQVGAINDKIPCNAIRGPLQQVWKNWSLPVPLLNPPVYVTIQPKGLSVTGITPTDNGIKLTARLDAVTGISSTAQPTQPLPLPENVAVTGRESQFSLALPLPVPYQLLAAAGSGGIVGKPVKSGKERVTPLQVEIIPSHDQLALGITVRDDTSGPRHGATGAIWFTASPSIDHDGHAIRLGNVTMTKEDRRALWHDISTSAAHSLGTTLANSYSYDSRSDAAGTGRAEQGSRRSEKYRGIEDRGRQ